MDISPFHLLVHLGKRFHQRVYLLGSEQQRYYQQKDENIEYISIGR